MIIPTKEKEIFIEEVNKNLQIPEDLQKEILILRKLGLENYEIKYLIALKLKEKIREKWKE